MSNPHPTADADPGRTRGQSVPLRRLQPHHRGGGGGRGGGAVIGDHRTVRVGGVGARHRRAEVRRRYPAGSSAARQAGAPELRARPN